MATVEVYKRSGETVDADPQTPGDQPEATRYEYDLVGNLLRERKPNGVVADHVYDSLNRLDVLREFLDNNGNGVFDAGDDLLTWFDYTVRADGRRTGAVEQFWIDGAMQQNTIDWSYDNLGRLVDEVFDHYDDAFDQTDRFVYDLVGNRLEHTRDRGNNGTIDETTGYLYDANDRLLSEWFDGDGLPGAERATSYGYLGTQETSKEVHEGGVLQSKTEYTYNLQGRMATVTVTSYESGVASRVERSTYGYSASGIRVSALVETDADGDGTFDTATKTEYLNDPQNHTGYSQVLAETVTDAATGEVQKRVVYTLGHDRLSQTTTTYAAGEPAAVETLHFGQDGHGSTRVLFDALGAIATVAGVPQAFHYTAYGEPLGFDPSTAATPFLYSGEQTDPTGLQYLRARYYNPATGRFTRLDPFAGNLNDP
ncbi:MAG: RHS repeat-associated core domain-containing protein, partial [Thermoguttaceae bacterium]|nr:RHS repeat-associated core domain-containing protein [Thermoguttaceae bacterium]